MSRNAVMEKVEKKYLKTDIPPFQPGDTVKVHFRIREGNKERVQVFQGTVIGRSGTGISETFSVHRIAYGEGMERVFPLHSPRIDKIEVLREGDVRRAKLYHIRGKKGKQARIRSRVVSRYANRKTAEAETVQEEVVEEVVSEEVNNAESQVTETAAEPKNEEPKGDTEA